MSEDNKNNNEEIMDSCNDLCDAENNRMNLEKALSKQNVWGYSDFGLESKKAAMSMLATKHGMYSRIPLNCKGEGCPYSESCTLLAYNLAPYGEYCPIETAQIETRYVEYSNDFGLDESSFTDRNLVSEIINLDIMIERCKALMAKEGVPVVDVVAGIGENGEAYYRPEVSKYWEAYEKAQKRRNDIYNLMMATRKDKSKTVEDGPKGIHDVLSKVIELENDGGFVVEERPEHLKDDKK